MRRTVRKPRHRIPLWHGVRDVTRFSLIPVRFGLQLLCALPAGAIGVLAFAPLQLWPVALLSLFFLFALWQRASTAWRAFAIGFTWGLGLFVAGVPWIFVSLHFYGSMPAMLAAVATLLFCCYLSLFPALAGVLLKRLIVVFGVSAVAALLLVIPACFVIFEYVRGWFFSGFPWLVVGYSQTPGGPLLSPLQGYAPILGVFGISWVMAMTAGLLVLLVSGVSGLNWSRRGRVAALAALAVVWGMGAALHRIPWGSDSGAPFPVALLQGNIEQSLKWREDQRDATLESYRELFEKSIARLIVLPETAMPFALRDAPAAYLASVKRRAEANDGDAIVGIAIIERGPSQSDPYSVTNSAITLGRSPQQRYDKQHLVVFGEFIPPFLGWVYKWLQIPLGSMAEGRSDQKPLRIAGHAIAVNICYEDAFGAEIVRQLPEAELLVNMSNMAWFGKYLASDQQTQFSQMRSLETARWILRSTNTGVTAAINEKGKIVKALPQFTRGVLDVEVQARTGVTPYIIWNDWMILQLLLAALVGGCLLKTRRSPVGGVSGR